MYGIENKNNNFTLVGTKNRAIINQSALKKFKTIKNILSDVKDSNNEVKLPHYQSTINLAVTVSQDNFESKTIKNHPDFTNKKKQCSDILHVLDFLGFEQPSEEMESTVRRLMVAYNYNKDDNIEFINELKGGKLSWKYTQALNRILINDKYCVPLKNINDCEKLYLADNETTLDWGEKKITSLHGIEQKTNENIRKKIYYINLASNYTPCCKNITYEKQPSLGNLFTNLTTLSLMNNSIEEIDNLFFRDLIHLKVLYLNDNQIKTIHPNAMKDLSQLTNLYLGRNNIKTIEFLKHLTNLIFLELVRNKVSDIKYLLKISYLSSLNISFNKIENTDIEKLVESTNIHILICTPDSITINLAVACRKKGVALHV